MKEKWMIKRMKSNMATLRKEIKESNKTIIKKRKPPQKQLLIEREWILLKIEVMTWRANMRK